LTKSGVAEVFLWLGVNHIIDSFNRNNHFTAAHSTAQPLEGGEMSIAQLSQRQLTAQS